MKTLTKILKYIVYAILIFLAIIFVSVFVQTRINTNKIPSIFGYKPFIVLSGSMESELYKGDLAIVKKTNANKLKKNDIIAFRDTDDYVVTHRIIEITDVNGTKEFITKGDNNNNKDSGSVSYDKVEGLYIGKISGFGNVLLIMQKPVTLIIILIVIVIGGTLWIVLGNNKLSIDERKELEMLRKERNSKK